jgi:TIR domain-containing protein
MARRVFISYAREDREVAALLAKQLEAQGFVVWWDWQLVGGTNYRHAIQEELTKADKAIVMWSRHSIRSDFVIDEASTAKTAGKLVPISIDGSAPPLGFGGLHTIAVKDLSEPSPEIATAVGSESTRAGPLQALSVLGSAQTGREGLYSTIEYHVAEYLRWLAAMVVQPDRVIRRTRSAGANDQYLSYMTRIVLISVMIGATIGALIPDRPPLLGRVQIFLVLSLLWLFLSLLVHLTCRLFGGKEGIGTTVTLMMQALAFAYVVSNFLTLLVVVASRYYGPLIPESVLDFKQVSPGVFILGLQFILLLYLVPLTVSRAHSFGGARWFLVALCAAALTLLLGLPVAAMGGC